MTRVVAIHQPNFFPWLGYFDKIARSDVFIFLDDVQFPKTGGVWCNRVKMLVAGESRWVTASIDRDYHGTRLIRDMQFLGSSPWREKLLKSLSANYGRHPYFSETMSVIEPLIDCKESNIVDYNIRAITLISDHIGLDAQKFKLSSSFKINASSNELLVALTKEAGGDTYLRGGGADGYQDDDIFASHNLQVLYQNFQHPIYLQRGQDKFISDLSVVDVAMNLGFEGIKNLMAQRAL